ncbi:MAG: MaoC family dehydratase [Pseudomonadota bacterium]
MQKTNAGFFFEDYAIGQVIAHAVPRTVGAGERALYHALYPARHALASSDTFARRLGFPGAPLDDLIVFHTIFGKTVPDISLNAVANLGYAEGRFLAPVFPGATLQATSEVIGLKENSNGKTGIVWVRTRGTADGVPVLEYVRWVMVRKRDADAPAPETHVPVLAPAVTAASLRRPSGLSLADYDFWEAGEAHRLGDYAVGEIIDHVDAVTVEEAEHMMATRLWQNTAKVHFDTTHREDGKRLIYGGHVISLARALSFNGLANAQLILALNAGAHANPCFAGDTVRAWSEVLDRADLGGGAGALRLRLVAVRAGTKPGALRDAGGKYHPGILLDLDYWALVPV